MKVAFAVHKKAGNAVWRNRVKRLMRESYRLHKHALRKALTDGLLLVAFSPNKVNQKNFAKIHLRDVEPEIVDLLEKIRKSVASENSRI